MDDEKKAKLKLREKAFDKVYYIVLSFVVVVVSFYMYHFSGGDISKDPNDWGVFGDFMGGTLNPLLAFFSFMLLLLNLRLQRHQLDNTEEQLELNRKELELTRIELEKAANAQINSSKVMNEQLKTQTLQQFDSLFTHMMDQLNKFYDSIDHHHLKIILNSFTNLTYVKDQLERNQKCLRYESYLFLVLKNIDVTNFDQTNKQLYVDLIKATIPSDFLKLINISSVDVANKFSKKNYRELLSKFNFFEHLVLIKPNKPIETFGLIYLTKFFQKDAYRNNVDFQKVDTCWVYQEIIKLNEYHPFSKWIGGFLVKYKFFHRADINFNVSFSGENIALIYFKDKKIGSIAMDHIYLQDNLITCSGGDADICFKFDLIIQKEHGILELRYFGDDTQWGSIPELENGISLYGVFKD